MKKINILGSTGSIGRQALEVIRNNRDKYEVEALSCSRNVALLREQIREFSPKVVSVSSEKDASLLQKEFKGINVIFGSEAPFLIARQADYDIILTAIVGFEGVRSTFEAAKRGKRIALANKETLVSAGSLIMDTARENNSEIIPVDSEHSAIFQSLLGQPRKSLAKIWLTASGGPFRGYTLEELNKVTLKEALKHPNWSMGKKITVDSATLMNKGLELIEASVLFEVDQSDVNVLVHPQSVLHSAVEFSDGAVIGQLGIPSMHVPIAFAFSYPDRLDNVSMPFNFFDRARDLTFESVDEEVFKTIRMSREAAKISGSYPIALNAANEVLVGEFLDERIKFLDIQDIIEEVLENHKPVFDLSIDEIIKQDKISREETIRILKRRLLI